MSEEYHTSYWDMLPSEIQLECHKFAHKALLQEVLEMLPLVSFKDGHMERLNRLDKFLQDTGMVWYFFEKVRMDPKKWTQGRIWAEGPIYEYVGSGIKNCYWESKRDTFLQEQAWLRNKELQAYHARKRGDGIY